MSLLTLANLVRIERLDGVVLGLSDHNRDLIFDGQLYEAANSFRPTEMQNTASLSVNNGDLEGRLLINGINKADLRNGRYDGAEVSFFIINWRTLALVKQTLTGWLGDARVDSSGYHIEFRSLAQQLQQNVGRTYTAACNNRLGKDACPVVIADFTVSGSVTSVTDTSNFFDTSRTEADGWFNYGLLTFTSGENQGLAREVSTYIQATGEFVLLMPFPYDVAPSDTYTVYAGCDYSHDQCKNKFDVQIDFGGFKDIPGTDEIISGG